MVSMVRIPQRVLDIELPPFDPLNLRAGELRAQGRDVISLGQAWPYFPPPPSAIRAAQAALSSAHVHFYSTDPGRPSLRRALAERLHQETGADCEAGDLVITAGANHAFATALTTLVNPGMMSCCRRRTSRITTCRRRRPERSRSKHLSPIRRPTP